MKKLVVIFIFSLLATNLFASDEDLLINAIKEDRISDATYFLKSGINPNATDVFGKSALQLAISQDNFELVALLINSGANINETFNYTYKNATAINATLLYIAIDSLNFDLVKLALAKGANVNLETTLSFMNKTVITGNSLLWAVEKDNIEMVKLLLDKGASVNASYTINKQGETNTSLTSLSILYFAIANTSNYNLIKMLIDAKADVNDTYSVEKASKSVSNRTLLMLATSLKKDLPIIKLLLDRGANTKATDSNGLTAKHYTEDDDVINLLSSYK